MNSQLHNQIKQLSDRELLEGIYQMLLVVMQEQLISDSKQLGINVIADLLVDKMKLLLQIIFLKRKQL